MEFIAHVFVFANYIINLSVLKKCDKNCSSSEVMFNVFQYSFY